VRVPRCPAIRVPEDALDEWIKGQTMKYDWVINNLTSLDPDRHFVVLVSYEDRIGDPAMPPIASSRTATH